MTTEGLELDNKAIDAPDTKFDIKQSNARNSQTIFEKDTNYIGWGLAISTVQVNSATPSLMKCTLYNLQEINLTYGQLIFH